VARNIPCLGPVTHAGCGAICPSYNRGCYGCYGPKETPEPLA
jgi:coenzyme F420-reducing hydrogenase gamma subunit